MQKEETNECQGCMQKVQPYAKCEEHQKTDGETSQEKLTKLRHYPQEYDNEDLVEMLESREGTAVADQLKDILRGDLFDNQNSNALEIIRDFLKHKGEDNMAEDLDEYLKSSEGVA
jgi:hypothetical protein